MESDESDQASSRDVRKNKRHRPPPRDKATDGGDTPGPAGHDKQETSTNGDVANGARNVVFDLDESSSGNEENTEAEEQIGPLRSQFSSQSSLDSNGTSLVSDPAAHTPKMRATAVCVILSYGHSTLAVATWAITGLVVLLTSLIFGILRRFHYHGKQSPESQGLRRDRSIDSWKTMALDSRETKDLRYEGDRE